MEGTIILAHQDKNAFIDYDSTEDFKENIEAYGPMALYHYDSDCITPLRNLVYNQAYDICYFGENGIHHAILNCGKSDIEAYHTDKAGLVIFPANMRQSLIPGPGKIIVFLG